MTRMRRTYVGDVETEDEITVVPIYMTRTRNRMTRTRNRISANGQSSIGNYQALFRPSTDIIESDSLIYNGIETSISTFDPIIYNGKTYLMKVTFG